MAERLVALDPDRAARLRARTPRPWTTELTELDQDFRQRPDHCDRKEFITTHAAFGYLAKRYQLTQIAISGLSPRPSRHRPGSRPCRTRPREYEITTIFYETLVSPAVASPSPAISA